MSTVRQCHPSFLPRAIVNVNCILQSLLKKVYKFIVVASIRKRFRKILEISLAIFISWYFPKIEIQLSNIILSQVCDPLKSLQTNEILAFDAVKLIVTFISLWWCRAHAVKYYTYSLGLYLGVN